MAPDPEEFFDLDAAAATLLANASDTRIMLRVLVGQLSDVLGPGLVVERSGGRFSRSREISSVEVSVGDDVLRADVSGASVQCTIARVSGGIRIRREQVDMGNWLTRLLQALRDEAAHSEAARQALESIVIGGEM